MHVSKEEILIPCSGVCVRVPASACPSLPRGIFPGKKLVLHAAGTALLPRSRDSAWLRRGQRTGLLLLSHQHGAGAGSLRGRGRRPAPQGVRGTAGPEQTPQVLQRLAEIRRAAAALFYDRAVRSWGLGDPPGLGERQAGTRRVAVTRELVPTLPRQLHLPALPPFSCVHTPGNFYRKASTR